MPCMRVALLFKTIAPNLRLYLNVPWLQYKNPEVCMLFWGFFLSFRRKIEIFSVLCLCRINVTVRSEYKRFKLICDKDGLRTVFRKYKRDLGNRILGKELKTFSIAFADLRYALGKRAY